MEPGQDGELVLTAVEEPAAVDLAEQHHVDVADEVGDLLGTERAVWSVAHPHVPGGDADLGGGGRHLGTADGVVDHRDRGDDQGQDDGCRHDAATGRVGLGGGPVGDGLVGVGGAGPAGAQHGEGPQHAHQGHDQRVRAVAEVVPGVVGEEPDHPHDRPAEQRPRAGRAGVVVLAEEDHQRGRRQHERHQGPAAQAAGRLAGGAVQRGGDLAERDEGGDEAYQQAAGARHATTTPSAQPATSSDGPHRSSTVEARPALMMLIPATRASGIRVHA